MLMLLLLPPPHRSVLSLSLSHQFSLRKNRTVQEDVRSHRNAPLLLALSPSSTLSSLPTLFELGLILRLELVSEALYASICLFRSHVTMGMRVGLMLSR
mmetsp:Transcript_7171/g.15328  ORF Transcript_7171/g.15328 Transcript_7171/m.15328 type:complete len:99 (+) Transcript_7171:1160-1456(+)